MEINLNPYCLDASALPVNTRAPKRKQLPTQQADATPVQRISPREYDQLVADAWRIVEAGYPRLAETAMAEAGISLHIDGDGHEIN